MNKIDVFNKQLELKKKMKNKSGLYESADPEKVASLLSEEINEEKIASFDYLNSIVTPIEINREEAIALLNELEEEFDEKKLTDLLEQTKKDLVSAIVVPFGLGKIVAAYDKAGGNVTTIHNANNGIYARDKDHYKREDYTNTKNSAGKQFSGIGKNSVGSNFTQSKMDENQMVQDAYTGEVQKANTTSPDHIESLSQHHKNGAFMQNSERKSDFATDENNMALTDRSINQSMRDFDKKEWMEKETKDNVKNKDRFNIDEEKLKEQIKKGKETSDKHLPSDMEKTQYYIKNSAITGLNEGVKMGAQQAFGVLLIELFTSAFSEIKDAFKNGQEGESLFEDIKCRLVKISKSLTSKWSDVLKGFATGSLSGFISNILTTIINVFVTTGKRLVRMIREGVFSLLKALKTVVFPPEGLTYREATHEAMKLFAAGGIIIAGVALEEIVEKIILNIPVLAPLASMVTAVIVGSITAMGMALVAYLIDKLDLLGAIKIHKNQFVIEKLNTKIDLHYENIDKTIDDFVQTHLS